MNLYPFRECVSRADTLIKAGWTIYQEFICSSCGTKQIMDTPNTFYLSGTCEECSAVTDIEKDGCNYLVVNSQPKNVS